MSSLSWRLTALFRKLHRSIQRLRISPPAVRIAAALRHPTNSRKRKIYRARYSFPIPTAALPIRPSVSRSATNLQALVRHPFSRPLRRAYRQRLRITTNPQWHSGCLISSSLPTVSAIVPNYNHARFLRERLASILEQRLPVSEIIILDDASTDDSRDVIASSAANIRLPVKTVFNDTNSNNVFRQWAKGISLAQGDLVWICESDDTCDPGFLETLVPYLRDQSVLLAFGWIDFINEDGCLLPGMRDYMEGAAPDYWHAPRVESAYTWFRGPFGIRNIIPNVGGCIFRRQQIDANFLTDLTSYRVCGDWYFYSRIARGGRIAYDPKARAYFRQHQSNTSVSSFKTESFYKEHIRIAQALRCHYGTGPETIRKMLEHVEQHCRMNLGDTAARELAGRTAFEDTLTKKRTSKHILIAIHGFQTGGGELFPIHLANELSRRGYDVSVLIMVSEPVNESIRQLLRAEIPVYTKAFVEGLGIETFFNEFGVDIIHTHNVDIDKWLYYRSQVVPLPYVVTHHGSYECEAIDADFTTWLIANVNHWIYIADKNLAFLRGFPRDNSTFTKLPNALPRTEGTFQFSRKDLGIEPNAFVFGLASRAILSKGWDIAIKALRLLRQETTRSVHLLLCGDGRDLDSLKAAYGKEPSIQFLGFQNNIQAFYRICDCCVLPTRFDGESYPLTIIEAILAGIPTIATDIGEIRSILGIDREPMGIVVPPNDNDAAFTESVRQAMMCMLNDVLYEQLRSSVKKHQNLFSMDKLVSDYIKIYDQVTS